MEFRKASLRPLPEVRQSFPAAFHRHPQILGLADFQNDKQNTKKLSHPRNNKKTKKLIWLVVSTHLKHISQIGSFPQVGVKIKNV